MASRASPHDSNVENFLNWTKIKKESPDNEIKEFAETAMNELLGWYGYEKMARDETKILQNLTTPPASTHAADMASVGVAPKSTPPRTRSRKQQQAHHKQPPELLPIVSIHSTNSTDEIDSSLEGDENKNHENGTDTNDLHHKRAECDMDDDENRLVIDQHRPRRRNLISSKNDKSPSSTGTSSKASPDEFCNWCNKILPDNACQIVTSSNGSFCSELCFSQSRRASFKKNKTCDWCRHVRHTVSYVDFQEGASQLQFCSDKCLNQYKMQIFCREAQAHLELHPHMHVTNVNDSSVQQGLITPDLWLRNCRSPTSSENNNASAARSPSPSYSSSPNATSVHAINSSENKTPQPQQTSPLPLITVAHPSKLMAFPPASELETRHERKYTPKPNHHSHQNHHSNKKSRRNSQTLRESPPQVQDLRVIPPSAHSNQHRKISETNSVPENLTNHPYIPHHPTQKPPNVAPTSTPLPNPLYFDPLRQIPIDPRLLPPNLFPHPFLASHLPNAGIPLTGPPQLPINPYLNPLSQGLVPPVTVLVPYPIILPVPLPIPIPVPFKDFLNAAKTKENVTNTNEATDLEKPTETDAPNNENAANPLENEKELPEALCANKNDDNVNNEESAGHETKILVPPTIDSPTRPLRKRKRAQTKALLQNSNCSMKDGGTNCKSKKPKFLPG